MKNGLSSNEAINQTKKLNIEQPTQHSNNYTIKQATMLEPQLNEIQLQRRIQRNRTRLNSIKSNGKNLPIQKKQEIKTCRKVLNNTTAQRPLFFCITQLRALWERFQEGIGFSF